MEIAELIHRDNQMGNDSCCHETTPENVIRVNIASSLHNTDASMLCRLFDDYKYMCVSIHH